MSRYGEAGFSITELGLIATADKVKPVLVKRPLGNSDPAQPTRACARPISADAGTRPNLYEMDLLQPGHEVSGRRSSSIRRPRSSSIRGDRVFVDEWTLLHYRHA